MFSIWSQAHPVLHSSPTRRSSDLAGIAVVDNGESFSVISQQPFRCHTPIGRRALGQPAENAADHSRSEERRVGKECRSRWSAEHEKKKREKEATGTVVTKGQSTLT